MAEKKLAFLFEIFVKSQSSDPKDKLSTGPMPRLVSRKTISMIFYRLDVARADKRRKVVGV